MFLHLSCAINARGKGRFQRFAKESIGVPNMEEHRVMYGGCEV